MEQAWCLLSAMPKPPVYVDGKARYELDSPIVEGVISGKQAKDDFVSDLLAILGDDVRGLWLMDKTGTTVADSSRRNHNLTWNLDVSAMDIPAFDVGAGSLVKLKGVALGEEFGTVGAHPDLDLTAGGQDQAFSFIVLNQFDAISGSTLVIKGAETPGDRSYHFGTIPLFGFLRLALTDEDNSSGIEVRAGEHIDEGPATDGIKVVKISPDYANDTTVFTYGDFDGVFKSTDGGVTWTLLTGPSVFGSEKDIIVSPDFANDSTLLILSLSGSQLERSTDGGTSFQNVLSASFERDTVVFSPDFAADDTIFAARATGVYKSTDGGDSWVFHLTGAAAAINALGISPDFAVDATLIAAEALGKLRRSTDGGLTWAQVADLPFLGNVQKVIFSPNYAVDETIFVFSVFGGGIFSSTDKGNNWSQLALGGSGFFDADISHNFANDATLFANLVNVSANPYKSTDGGVTWQLTNDINGGAVAISPNYVTDATVFFGASGIYKSINRGVTWVKLSSGDLMLLTGTYDGSLESTGLRIYKNRNDVSATHLTTGTYVGMKQVSGDLLFGRGLAGDSFGLDGGIALVGIVARELSAHEVWELVHLMEGYYQVALRG